MCKCYSGCGLTFVVLALSVDTIIYASSFFGDELWPTDKVSFTQSAINACPPPVNFILVRANNACTYTWHAPDSLLHSHSYVSMPAGARLCRCSAFMYICLCTAVHLAYKACLLYVEVHIVYCKGLHGHAHVVLVCFSRKCILVIQQPLQQPLAPALSLNVCYLCL